MPFQTVNLKASGLYTNPNYLSSVPEGSFVELINFNHDRDDIIEKRRGFAVYSNLLDQNPDQLFQYKDKLLTFYGSTIAYDNAGTFVEYADSFFTPSPYRMKGMTANGNFYITTTEGIKKLDVLNTNSFNGSTWKNAGAERAPSITGEVEGTVGFLPALSKTAYRIVWGYKDNNNNLIIGAPSEIEVVTNEDLSDSVNVELTFNVPNDATDSYFYQVYRAPYITAASLGDLENVLPQDEMNLVIEEFPTNGQFTSKIVTVLDVTPEDFRNGGTPLYTNAVSGDGILSANSQPPLCEDVTLYRNYAIYANTKTKHNYVINLLSVDDLYSNLSKIILSDETNFETYTFGAAEDIPNKIIKLETSGTVGFNVEQTARSIAKVINSQVGGFLRAYYISALDDVPGQILLERGNLEDTPFYVAVSNGDVEEFNQTPALVNDIENFASGTITTKIKTFNSTTNVNVGTDTITLTGHEYFTGQEVLLSGILPAGLSSQIYYIFRIDANSFKLCLTRSETKKETPTFVDITATAVGTGNVQETHELLDGEQIQIFDNVDINGFFNVSIIDNVSFTISQTTPALSSGGSFFRTSSVSENEAAPNRLYYSKLQQPEAVPAINFIDVGTKEKAIRRVVALRDSLFIFKEEGIFRLSGQSPQNFNQELFDNSATITAPDSAAVLNNKIYVLTSQGVLMISDTGVDLISKPIENILLQYGKNPNFDSLTFGFSSESDRAYFLFLPRSIADTTATICLRYNSDTNSWSMWDKAHTCGIWYQTDDKIYLGTTDKYIEQERKNLDRTDFADRIFNAQLGNFSINDYVIKNITPFTQLDLGDVITQTQYVTLTQYNQLLKKLDNDLLLFKLISNINLGFPTEIELAVNHNITTGEYVLISDVDGTADTRLNTTHLATVIDATTLSVPVLTSIYTATNGKIKYAYFLNLMAEAGDNLIAKVRNLAERLSIDLTDTFSDSNGLTGFFGAGAQYVWDTTNEPSTPILLQEVYNKLIDRLNQSSETYFINYKQSTGSILYEEVITKIDAVRKEVTVNSLPNLIQGDLVVYKGIRSVAKYNFVSMGDPSVSKRIIDAGIILEKNNFTNCEIQYATDISKNYEGTLYTAEAVGLFGNVPYNFDGFGGSTSSRPARIMVPRDKARCRYISPAIVHYNAREEIAIYGFNMTAEVTSQRAFRGKNG